MKIALKLSVFFLISVIVALPMKALGGGVGLPALVVGSVGPMEPLRASLSNGAAMPLPQGQEVFTYEPSFLPVKSEYPAQAKPVGLGPVAEGSDTLDATIGFEHFSGPADIYLAFTLSADPETVYIVKSDLSLQAFTMQEILQALAEKRLPAGAEPWKKSAAGPIDESLFNLRVGSIAPGTYTIYALVTPADTMDAYYLWITYFNSQVIVNLPCTYTYSNWGECQPDGTQTRQLLSSTPAGCVGTPVLSQSCVYVPPAQCADISGSWNYTNSGRVTCTFDGETDWEDVSGSGKITITQNGCDVIWYDPTFNEKRSGSVSGNNLQVSGKFVVPLVTGINFTSNIYGAQGTVSGQRVDMSGSGSASGTYCESGYCYQFSCTGTDTAVLTR